MNIGNQINTNTNDIASLLNEINSLKTQMTDLIKIKARCRVAYSANQYTFLSYKEVASVTKLASGICGIMLSTPSNTLLAWSPYISVMGGTRCNVLIGADAGYPNYHYVVMMSSDFGFNFMLLEG